MKITLPQRSKGRPRTQQPELITTVVTSDHHIPEMDTASYRAVLNFIRDQRPDYHFLAGDVLDCHDQSSFIKDPELTGRTVEAIDLANQMLDELHEASPTTLTRVLWGNHESRLTKRLWENPDLLPFLTGKGKTPDHLLADALSLDERGIDWYPYKIGVNHFGFFIFHGEYANLHATKKELDNKGVAAVSGHIHKHRMWERKDLAGVKHWYSIGGLCKTNPSYRPMNDWVNGFGVLKQVVGTDIYTFQQIPIVRGQFVYGYKLYSQDGVFETR